jgi:hypothetical protein
MTPIQREHCFLLDISAHFLEENIILIISTKQTQKKKKLLVLCTDLLQTREKWGEEERENQERTEIRANKTIAPVRKIKYKKPSHSLLLFSVYLQGICCRVNVKHVL